jgi:uncharacterized membrane protein YecN with MAPEG domain
MLITHMQVFALYAALNGLIILILSVLVTRARRRHKILLGDGANESMLRAQRAHGNAVEYVPIVLILLLTLASLQASMILIHVIGILLTFGRILHAIGLSRSSTVSIGRSGGILLTWLALLLAIVGCFFYALR